MSTEHSFGGTKETTAMRKTTAGVQGQTDPLGE